MCKKEPRHSAKICMRELGRSAWCVSGAESAYVGVSGSTIPEHTAGVRRHDMREGA